MGRRGYLQLILKLPQQKYKPVIGAFIHKKSNGSVFLFNVVDIDWNKFDTIYIGKFDSYIS